MLSDKQLVNLMVSEPSWEEVVYKIISEEEMDPWKINIIKLSEVFVNYLDNMERLDLRIPARFILIAAVLVRMKSDILSPRKTRVLIPGGENPEDEELYRMLSEVPPLEAPVERIPLRTVTMNELVTALKKAFEVEERRKIKKEKRARIVKRALPETEEDITERINKLLEQIESALKDVKGTIEFSRIVKKWERKEIVKTLMPLLHLANEGKIKLDQRELFKEITVSKDEKDKSDD